MKKIYIVIVAGIIIISMQIYLMSSKRNEYSKAIQNLEMIKENVEDSRNENIENNIDVEKINIVEEIEQTNSELEDKDDKAFDKNGNNSTIIQEKKEVIESKEDKDEKKDGDENESIIKNVEQEEKDIVEKNEERPKNEEKENEQEEINTKLANTKYRKETREVIQEIVEILNQKIKQDENLNKIYEETGIQSYAIQANKNDINSNTTEFTYIFINDIYKGKVAGNYTKFSNRLNSYSKAVGKHMVYAEDEYVYDSRGINSYWTQTLVYIQTEI